MATTIDVMHYQMHLGDWLAFWFELHFELCGERCNFQNVDIGSGNGLLLRHHLIQWRFNLLKNIGVSLLQSGQMWPSACLYVHMLTWCGLVKIWTVSVFVNVWGMELLQHYDLLSSFDDMSVFGNTKLPFFIRFVLPASVLVYIRYTFWRTYRNNKLREYLRSNLTA